MSLASFAELALSSPLQQTLKDLGYTAPTPIQAAAIPLVLTGRDLLAGAQTGTGKTAAFVLPILQLLMVQQTEPAATRPIRALVLVPTRELAVQVHESVLRYGKETGLTSALVYGGVSIAAQVEALRNGVDILIATPGRLLDHLRQGALSLSQLTHLVFDEADRMLDMGFMDEIKALLRQIPAERQTLLFSATCDDNLYALSKVLLRDPALIEVAPRNTTAAEIEQRVYTVDGDRKQALVEHLIKVKGYAPALIFSRTRQGADQLAQRLGKAGINALAFHGDLSQSAREKVLLEFRAGTLQALVATDVAARGLDILDLNYVINLEFPHQPEDYVHRIGRTGRAGNKGLAITLFSQDDAPLLEKVEAVLDTRLPQQWFPGFEPDLTRFEPEPRRNSRAAQKQKARKQALTSNKSGKGKH
ncbi:DEAD/DEAH box helicase [Aeromonas lusitana]|uniref:DEAD-box ATP-dependent RNA helicase RhpA n=1 Tax=Aeromonas lusitana TaxID=931529 RepID=A0A2M8HB05_9GAMM|nr:DEAD/DEAH box helicase [Aeromonas lusitana]PJC93757.1 DEAD/DEAH box helicase [Aeromonas lusitana]